MNCPGMTAPPWPSTPFPFSNLSALPQGFTMVEFIVNTEFSHLHTRKTFVIGYTQTHKHTYTHTNTHRNSHTHAHIHTHRQKHTHTYSQTSSLARNQNNIPRGSEASPGRPPLMGSSQQNGTAWGFSKLGSALQEEPG